MFLAAYRSRTWTNNTSADGKLAWRCRKVWAYLGENIWDAYIGIWTCRIRRKCRKRSCWWEMSWFYIVPELKSRVERQIIWAELTGYLLNVPDRVFTFAEQSVQGTQKKNRTKCGNLKSSKESWCVHEWWSTDWVAMWVRFTIPSIENDSTAKHFWNITKSAEIKDHYSLGSKTLHLSWTINISFPLKSRMKQW